MKQIDVIQNEVGAWSLKNFGRQETTELPTMTTPLGIKVELNSLAPMLGIVEELGELFEAGSDNDAEDAIGDILVYLCDYASRESIPLPIGRNLKFRIEEPRLDPMSGLVVWIGKLYHGQLKRFQGIRGFDEKFVWEKHRDYCLAMILEYISLFLKDNFDTSILVVLNKTWNDVVSKRDWNDDPNSGGNHDHHAS